MKSKSPPPEPNREDLPKDWPHAHLHGRVRDAIRSLPIHFSSETYIEGISATDIFTLNSALGATIEDQVVSNLNRMRSVWDPEKEYSLYGFVRQPQTFPDVLLRSDRDILFGIELKGWYLLSKEAEPSFRYTVTPGVCHPADLLVCVPWALKNVISGRPVVFNPYIEQAKHAAELRNYYWMFMRNTSSDRNIHAPEGPLDPYPNKSERIADIPVRDGGGNFGRIARTRIMDEFTQASLRQPLCGVPASAWLGFFKLFTESVSDQQISERLEALRTSIDTYVRPADERTARALLRILEILESELPGSGSHSPATA